MSSEVDTVAITTFDKWWIGILVGCVAIIVLWDTAKGDLRFVQLWFLYKVIKWTYGFFKHLIKDY